MTEIEKINFFPDDNELEKTEKRLNRIKHDAREYKNREDIVNLSLNLKLIYYKIIGKEPVIIAPKLLEFSSAIFKIYGKTIKFKNGLNKPITNIEVKKGSKREIIFEIDGKKMSLNFKIDKKKVIGGEVMSNEIAHSNNTLKLVLGTDNYWTLIDMESAS